LGDFGLNFEVALHVFRQPETGVSAFLRYRLQLQLTTAALTTAEASAAVVNYSWFDKL